MQGIRADATVVKNTELFELPCWNDSYGSLVAIEESDTVPFEIKRIYYIFDVGAQVRRGFHSHQDLQQALICVSGSVDVLIEDDEKSEVITLDSPTKALYIGPMVWREMFAFSEDAVLLVLASKHYADTEYERNHGLYLKTAREYYEQQKGE